MSAFINQRPKVLSRFRRVMTEDFPKSKLLMPLTRSWTRFRSVVYMLSRFLQIAGPLKNLFSHESGALSVLNRGNNDGKARASVKKFGRLLTAGALQLTIKTILEWAAPVYYFESWADGDYESSFFSVCSKWDIMERVPHICKEVFVCVCVVYLSVCVLCCVCVCVFCLCCVCCVFVCICVCFCVVCVCLCLCAVFVWMLFVLCVRVYECGQESSRVFSSDPQLSGLGLEWAAKLEERKSTFISQFHLAADVLLPINLYSRTLATQEGLNALSFVAEALLGAEAAPIVLETVKSMMEKTGDYSMTDASGQIRNMWNNLDSPKQPLTKT